VVEFPVKNYHLSTDGFRVGAHGFKDSNSGSHNCGPRDVVMANRKESELSLTSPKAYNGLRWVPGSTEGLGILFQLFDCDCDTGCNQVLEHVSGMDTGKAQTAITEMSNEGVVDVVQEERPKSVHVGNKLAELFQVAGVLTQHDRSDDSRCANGNHKMMD